jgi:hypothetical protein
MTSYHQVGGYTYYIIVYNMTPYRQVGGYTYYTVVYNTTPYRQVGGRIVSVLWDADGSRYGKGAGLRVFVDGQLAASSPTIAKLTIRVD